MDYHFTTDPAELDLDVIHRFITSTYWARGISKATMARAVAGSVCFGMTTNHELVAFGRMVTDEATFAYLADVFVLPEHRGRGLSKVMLTQALLLPQLQGLRRMLLATSDAHGLYQKMGFEPLPKPEIFMQKMDLSRYDLEREQ
ncbi:N-acetyltransferase [Arenicella chitinivorans]|uniref:N-acetyltransferase n=1 Tax=Arenicella chitinivorans TaxID=1329800 RepID=A0A918RLQ5_9GAMM|nr:GNAT family N-acetyltransferase [Arenicella chitinivorans]GHA02039.1 N-acetyltransferase [Arenicella chitinivorans]